MPEEQQAALSFDAEVKNTLSMPPLSSTEEVVAEIRLLLSTRAQAIREYDALHTGAVELWQLFHRTFRGLKCGVNGSWAEAIEEVANEIRLLQGENARLQAMQLSNVSIRERTTLVESIPGLAKRVEALEALVQTHGIGAQNAQS